MENQSSFVIKSHSLQCGPPRTGHAPVSYHDTRLEKELHHSNVKYVQPVKVVPDGPPVPAVLVSKGHTRNDYAAPSYNAPKPVYQAPKPTYDKPRYDGYGAPKANDAAPTSYSPPKPTYNAPSPTYGAPKPSYQPPPVSGLDSYSAPKPSYNAPSSSYGAPKPTYNAPSSSYGVPKPTYNAPPTYHSKSDTVDHVGIKRESVDHSHSHAPIGHHDHSHNHNHGHNHGGQDQGHRQGRLEECICMPANQCPSHSVMPFGNGVGGGFGNGQQNAPLRQDVTPLQDYSGLIDPRIKADSDIVAAGEHDQDDTLDLEEAIDDKIDSNRAR